MDYNDNESTEGTCHFNKVDQHPLALHLEEVRETVKGIFAYPKKDNEVINVHINIVLESLQLIKAKFHSALQSNNYLICMQNAAIIRFHAHNLLLYPHTLDTLQCFDKEHVAVYKKEMEKFQELFTLWALEIKAMDKTDFHDPWGLF